MNDPTCSPPTAEALAAWSDGVDAIEFMIQAFGWEDVKELRVPAAEVLIERPVRPDLTVVALGPGDSLP